MKLSNQPQRFGANGLREPRLGGRTSRFFTLAGTASQSQRNHLIKVDSPTPLWVAKSFTQTNRHHESFSKTFSKRVKPG